MLYRTIIQTYYDYCNIGWAVESSNISVSPLSQTKKGSSYNTLL